MTTNLTTVLILAGAAGGAYLLARRAASSAPPTPAPSKDPCEALKGVNDTAYTACRGAKGVLGVISGIADALKGKSTAKKLADNNKLNGEIEVEIGAAHWRNRAYEGDGGGGPPPGALDIYRFGLGGNVARYKNGCVPFEGAPGWERCVSGTESMEVGPSNSNCGASWFSFGYGGHSSRRHFPLGFEGKLDCESDGSEKISHEHMFDGSSRDPFTVGPFVAGMVDIPPELRKHYGSTLFPLPLGPGDKGYLYKGQPIKVPAGHELVFVADHRGGKEEIVPQVVPIGGVSVLEGATLDGKPVFTGTTGKPYQTPILNPDEKYVPGTCPAGFTWDASINAWRRLRVGETQACPPGTTPTSGNPGAPAPTGGTVGTYGGVIKP